MTCPNRYERFDRLAAAAKAQRKRDPRSYLMLPELHGCDFLRVADCDTGHCSRGGEAWRALYDFMAALTALPEVARFAPAFPDHLRAAAECLEPVLRAYAAAAKTPEDKELFA